MSTVSATVPAYCKPKRRTTKQERSRKARADRVRRGTKGQHSAEEKAAIRAEHRDRIARALEALETPDGMARFLKTRELNPQLTPLAAATAALEAPDRVVMTLRQWNNAGARVHPMETQDHERLSMISTDNSLSADQVLEARDWLADCFEDDPELELSELSDSEIVSAVSRHYDGGIAAFRNDSLSD